MVNISASIPEQLKEWIDIQIEQGLYSSTSDYLRDLIRTDQSAKQKLENLLLEGKNSDSIEIDDSFWKKKKEALSKHFL